MTPAACEGTSTLFEVPYFDLGRAYLTQSGQLYNEATAAAHGKVYCFGPTFRAEKSKTRRQYSSTSSSMTACLAISPIMVSWRPRRCSTTAIST